MSSVLKRKKKKMQPLGYKDEIHVFNQQQVRRLNYATELAEKTFLDIKLVSLQILHDKFGLGKKRIQRLEAGINTLLDGDTSCSEMVHYLSEKKGIDLSKVDIPERELLGFQNLVYNNDVLPVQNKLKLVLGSVSDYIVLSITALKTVFKFSKKQIDEYVSWIKFYINSISRGYETMTGVASVLYHECDYCDARFVGKVYEI